MRGWREGLAMVERARVAHGLFSYSGIDFDAEDSDVVRLYKQGLSQRKISKRTGISYRKVCRMLWDAGHLDNVMDDPDKVATIKRVAAMRESGLSCCEIGRRLNMSHTTISNYLLAAKHVR